MSRFCEFADKKDAGAVSRNPPSGATVSSDVINQEQL